MKLALPPASSFYSAGRSVLQFSLGAVTAAAGFGLVNADQAHDLSAEISAVAQAATNLFNGVQTLVGALTMLSGTALAVYGAWTRSRNGILLAAAANPEVDRVVMKTSEAAQAVPSPKVTSS